MRKFFNKVKAFFTIQPAINQLLAGSKNQFRRLIRRHVKPETISVYAAGDFAKAAAGAAATGAK